MPPGRLFLQGLLSSAGSRCARALPATLSAVGGMDALVYYSSEHEDDEAMEQHGGDADQAFDNGPTDAVAAGELAMDAAVSEPVGTAPGLNAQEEGASS